jgi:hypothetical protein
VDRHVQGMAKNSPTEIHAPDRYLTHFTPQEFKFRWAEALMAETSKWRTSTDLLTALVLASFMGVSGDCHPGMDRVAQAMKTSRETTRRSVRRLEERGWLIVIPRPQKTNQFLAVLPEYGLDLLVESRGIESRGSSVDEWNTAVESVIEPVCLVLGVARAEWSHMPEWARVEGRVRQIIQRMGGPTADLSSFIGYLCNEPPQQLTSPPGYILFKAGEFGRLFNSFAGGKRKPREDSVSQPDFVNQVVTQTGMRLSMNNKKEPVARATGSLMVCGDVEVASSSSVRRRPS